MIYTTQEDRTDVLITMEDGEQEPVLKATIPIKTFESLAAAFIAAGCTVEAYKAMRAVTERIWDTTKGEGFARHYAMAHFMGQYIYFPWTPYHPDPTTLEPGMIIQAYWPKSSGYVTVHHVSKNHTIYVTRYIKKRKDQSAPRRLYDCGTHYSTLDEGPTLWQ